MEYEKTVKSKKNNSLFFQEAFYNIFVLICNKFETTHNEYLRTYNRCNKLTQIVTFGA